MTLVLTINGPETIWLVADRRLSRKGLPLRDDARKTMFLETTDGLAILGYAGLGATALGTEPADWMSAVLRGRNLPLEQSLGVLADAIKQQLPRHMVRMPGYGGPAHTVLVPAFIGKEVRLYTIDLAFAPDRKNYAFRYTRHVFDKPASAPPRTPRAAIAGTGALYLSQNNNKRWIRSLLRLVRANDRGHVSALAVADYLANLNNEVHLGIADKSVGPRCIVAWRHRKGGAHKTGGGHQFYTGITRDPSSSGLPTIAGGMDVEAICEVIGNTMMPHLKKMMEAARSDHPPEDLNTVQINADLARLPEGPDENLR